MKLTTTTCAEIGVTLVLPDKYKDADQATIRQAIDDDEATVLAVEYPTANEAFSCAVADNQEYASDCDPLTNEETTALAGGYTLTHYYS